MKEKDLLYLLISVFILTILWIAGNIYNAFATTTIDPLLQSQIRGINHTFNRQAIQDIKERTEVDSAQGFTPQTPQSPTPTISETPIEEAVPVEETEDAPVDIEVIPTDAPEPTAAVEEEGL